MTAMLDFNDAPPTRPPPLSVALRYVEQHGWPVFPCNPITKAPLTDHGFKDASRDPYKVRSWWSQWPNAMIGIPTGAETFWVFDVDMDAAKGKNGVASLAAQGRDLSELMDTAVAQTASGGYHCLFAWDPARPVGSHQNRPWKDVDTRGQGGYVVMAGSTRADGRTYEWINPPDESDIAEAPEWLYEALQGGSAPFDFNSAPKAPPTPAERVAKIEPGAWHENTRDLVARMVREGLSDETISALAPRFTEPGYSHQQTVAEFLTHARTARAKWGYQPKDLEAELAPLPPAEDGSPRFRFNLTFFDDIPEEHHKSWLIRDILGAGEFSIVYGAPGCGKSVLMGDAAAHVAAGLPWFGRPTTQAAVLYVAAERHALVKRRLAAWRKHHGVLDLPLVVLDGLFNFATDQSHGEEIVRIAEHVANVTGVPVGWVIIDTKAQVMGGADENASKDIAVLNHNIARIQQIGTHVTVIDHTPQADPTRMKGNGGLAGAADGSYLVQKQGSVRSLSIGSKSPNDGPDDINITFDLKGIELGVSPDGQKTFAPVVIDATTDDIEAQPSQGLGKRQQAVLSAIVQASRDGQQLGFTRLVTITGLDRGSLGRVLRDLCEKDLIQEVGEEGAKRWVLL